MKHRNTFTKDEIERIKKLLCEKSKTLGKSDQKKIRDKLRQLGFYITDYDRSGQGFSLFDFKTLLHRGVIKVLAPIQERSISTNKQEAVNVQLSEQVGDQTDEDIDWQYAQKNSDRILSAGLTTLITSKKHDWNTLYLDGPGVYLFKKEDEYLYIGESLDLAYRVGQHCQPRKSSTFLKNYSKYLNGFADSDSIHETEQLCRSEITIQAINVFIGRKELEEFGIVNLPAPLNRFQKGKRKLVNYKKYDPDIWNTVQKKVRIILDSGQKIFFDHGWSKWFDAVPEQCAGLYGVRTNEEEFLYIGESTNLHKRHQTHSKNTYFSALRKNIGRSIFNAEYVAPKRFTADIDKKIDDYLSVCSFRSTGISFARRELEEKLVKEFTPLLNRK